MGEIHYLDLVTIDTQAQNKRRGEKMGKYGTVLSIKIRKSEYEKTKKESVKCFADIGYRIGSRKGNGRYKVPLHSP